MDVLSVLCDFLNDGSLKAAEELLRSGADPNGVCESGVTPIHLAAGLELTSLCLLLQHGGDPNVRLQDGTTPVHVAAMWGKMDCVQILLANGGDPFLRDQDGLSAHDLAVRYNHREVIHILDYYIQLLSGSGDQTTTPQYTYKRINDESILSGREGDSPSSSDASYNTALDVTYDSVSDGTLDVALCDDIQESLENIPRTRKPGRRSSVYLKSVQSQVDAYFGDGQKTHVVDVTSPDHPYVVMKPLHDTERSPYNMDTTPECATPTTIKNRKFDPPTVETVKSPRQHSNCDYKQTRSRGDKYCSRKSLFSPLKYVLDDNVLRCDYCGCQREDVKWRDGNVCPTCDGLDSELEQLTLQYDIDRGKYGVDREKYGVNTEKYDVDREKYGVNTEKYDVDREKYDVDRGKYFGIPASFCVNNSYSNTGCEEDSGRTLRSVNQKSCCSGDDEVKGFKTESRKSIVSKYDSNGSKFRADVAARKSPTQTDDPEGINCETDSLSEFIHGLDEPTLNNDWSPAENRGDDGKLWTNNVKKYNDIKLYKDRDVSVCNPHDVAFNNSLISEDESFLGRQSRHDDNQGRQSRHDDNQGRQSRHDDNQGRKSRHDDNQGRQSRHDDNQGMQSRQDDNQGRQSRHDDNQRRAIEQARFNPSDISSVTSADVQNENDISPEMNDLWSQVRDSNQKRNKLRAAKKDLDNAFIGRESFNSIYSDASTVEYVYTDTDNNIMLIERHIPSQCGSAGSRRSLNSTISGCTQASNDDVCRRSSPQGQGVPFELSVCSEDTVLYDWREELDVHAAGVGDVDGAGDRVRHDGAGDRVRHDGAGDRVRHDGAGDRVRHDLQHLDNDGVRSRLIGMGDAPGPVTKTTRQTYLTRLSQIERDGKMQLTRKGPGYPAELGLALDGRLDLSDMAQLEMNMVSAFQNPSHARRWREGTLKSSFNYILLDPRITCDLPNRANNMGDKETFTAFITAIFYVGKGKRSRPYSHLYEAIKQKKKQGSKTSHKVQRILDIWSCGLGVVSLHCFQSVIPVEAYTREACMVDAIGLQNLTNMKKGDYYGVSTTYSMKQRRKMGVYLLSKALKIFLADGERQISPPDIKTDPWATKK